MPTLLVLVFMLVLILLLIAAVSGASSWGGVTSHITFASSDFV
jgi:hypothetical protein